ncbi:MAG: hypothetical protein JWO38_1198 [Gemmataceae bacterium]|nr:hypothetical protein [Gemmataceae bacterium]
MAYNPFNIFRRNQRAIFAVVTVFIMFTFVLSSGLGGGADFFDWLPGFVRGKAKKGEQLCTIDGTKVYERDVYQLRTQRAMASKFMVYAAMQTSSTLQVSLAEQMAQGTPEIQGMLRLALSNPQMAGYVLPMIANNPKAKQADKDALKTLEVMTALQQNVQLARAVGTYFANAPNRTDRDRVEFILWDRKAKALGIEFGKDDVKALIQREFLGQFKPEAEIQVRDVLQKETPGFSLDACLTALAAEFRVRAAQTALLGDSNPFSGMTGRDSPGPGRTPNVFDPPYDMFEFYREKTSPTAYEALGVPGALFADKIPVPSDDQLQRLFNERKDYEPDPSKEEPGFREPRKVKVEWVSATGEEKYYQDAAKAWVSRAEQLVKSEVWGLIVPVPGMGAGAWAVLTAGPGAAKEPLVYEQYRTRVVGNHKFAVESRWGGASLFVLPMDILDTSIVRPQTLAAAAGGAAGAAAGFGPAFLPANLFYSAAVANEQRARVKAGLPLLLGGVPGPGLLATSVGGLGAYQAALPPPLPIEAVKPELLKEMTEHKARELAVADLKKLKEEVEKLTENGKAKDKSAAREYIAQFVKTRGLKTGGTTEPQSEWTIAEDPGLAPLKAIKDRGVDGTDPHAGLGGASPIQFGQKFFWTTNPMNRTREQASGTYKPEFYPEKAADAAASPLGKADPVFLVWRTEELPGKIVPFQIAKPRVIEAWKRIKARDLAKAEAERLANDLRAKPSTSEFIIAQDMADMQAQLQKQATDPKAKDRVRLFRIDNVAPIQIVPGVGGVGTDTIRPFQLTPTTDLPYPTQEMVKVLIEERTKPPKTVLVQPDQPKDTYYVIALLKREERDPDQFKSTFGGFGRGQVPTQLRGAFFEEARFKARNSVLELVKKELNYVETDDQKKRLDEREKKGEE